MRTRGSESFIVLPLLPIFLIGLFPILLLERTGQRTALRSEIRFALVMIASGAALAVAGIGGLIVS
jgi:hypothetical protein